nr:MAG TPA: hypothetical protein [Bacteriophage sp.]
MSKPMLHVMRAFFLAQLLIAVVFMPTAKAIRLLPLHVMLWAVIEIVNFVKTRKEVKA